MMLGICDKCTNNFSYVTTMIMIDKIIKESQAERQVLFNKFMFIVLSFLYYLSGFSPEMKVQRSMNEVIQQQNNKSDLV